MGMLPIWPVSAMTLAWAPMSLLVGATVGGWSIQDRDIQDSLRARWTDEMVHAVVDSLHAHGRLPVQRLAEEIVVQKFDIMRLLDSFPVLSMPFYDLRGAPLSNLDLGGVDLSFSILDYADLEGTDLTDAKLTSSSLRGARLIKANFSEADLGLAHLEGADMRHVDLSGANLRHATLFNANLTGARLVGVNLSAAELGYVSRAGGVLGAIDVTQSAYIPARLDSANLFLADLRGANLLGVSMEGANLFETVLCNTLVDVVQLEETINYQYVRSGGLNCYTTPWSYDELPLVENLHRRAKVFFQIHQVRELAQDYHFWENEARTTLSPWYKKGLRLVLFKWSYGYGTRPVWLLRAAALSITSFAIVFLILTSIKGTRSGIYRVTPTGEAMLRWRKGGLVWDCLYFSALSFATFGYGAIRPRQWLEFFRLEPVEYRPVRWARVFVGLEAACGIYLLALLAAVLFGSAT